MNGFSPAHYQRPDGRAGGTHASLKKNGHADRTT